MFDYNIQSILLCYLLFQTFYTNQSVKQIDVPSFNGAFGILPNHVPVLAVLKPGVVTVYEDDGAVKKVLVSSGTVSSIFYFLTIF